MENKINLDDIKTNISYLNNSLKDFSLPSTLYKFREKIKSIFQIENKTDEIFIIYTIQEMNEEKKKVEKIIEIKMEEDYKLLLNRINSQQVKDDIIFIETERVPDGISREIPQNFDDEIECLIKTHLMAAKERIKEGLLGKKELYPSSKINNKLCSKCRHKIIGDIFREVTTTEQKIYCEKCSYSLNIPMFVIH